MVRRVVKRMLQRRETIQVELQALVARQGRRGRGIVRDHVLVIACEPQDPLDESEAEGLRVGAFFQYRNPIRLVFFLSFIKIYM